MSEKHTYRRAGVVVLGVVLVYAALVSTHQGEFWPFSIYPMFSQGGKPWTRVLVRDVSGLPGTAGGQPLELSTLPGKPFPLLDHGIDAIDLGSFVGADVPPDRARQAALADLFAADDVRARRLLVLQVRGRMAAGDSIATQVTPYATIHNGHADIFAAPKP